MNTSKSRIDLIYNGKKITIPVGGIIEGPPHLKLYKGLSVYTENVTTLTTESNKIDITTEVNKDNIDNINKTLNHLKNYGGLPSIAICILTKNKYELISDCVYSILEKVKYPNTKIMIFDTGSTETNVLEFYKTLSGKKYPISIHDIGAYHFSKNYNDAIFKFVDTEYAIIQNNDTVALNDYISRLMKVAIVEKIGACGPRMLYKTGLIQHDGQYMFNHAMGSGFINPGHVNMGKDPTQVGGGRKIVDGITGAGLLVRTNLYKQLGGFDESFKDIYQDVHFNMLLRGSGYLSICDWDAYINHYDNTSRKELWKVHEEAAKMWKDSNRLFKEMIPQDIRLRSFKRKVPVYSIITLVNNKEQYFNFMEDLKKQKFNGLFEVIALPNFNNEFSSAAEALNVGKDLAEGEYVVYCHQDLRVPENWLQKISLNINALSKVNFGFLGMAGVLFTEDEPKKKQDGAIYLSNLNSKKEKQSDVYRKLLGENFEVQCLDELCIIGKKSDPFRFDETTFNHYHWYGADICLQAIDSGRKNYAINAECFHISDGLLNFSKPTHVEKYIDGLRKLYVKWSTKINKFRTTTASFNKSTKSAKILMYNALSEDIRKEFQEVYNFPL
jgi:GT2 family glycosyltransferase